MAELSNTVAAMTYWLVAATETESSGVNGSFKLKINNGLPFLLRQYADLNQDLY